MAFTSTSRFTSTLLLLASFTSKAAGQDCSLCPNGGEIAFPDKALSGLEVVNVTTCEEFDQFFSALPEEQCGLTVDTFESGLKYSAMCGCTDVAAPGICDSLCGEGDLIDPDQVIRENDDQSTCGGIDELLPFLVDATNCASFITLRPLCCSGGTAATCQLCPNGGEMAFPDKAVPFADEIANCRAFDQALYSVPEAECGSAVDESTFSFTALCGCTDASVPGICNFCGEGDLIDPDQVVPGNDGATCGEFEELTRYLTSEELCQENVSEQLACCTNPNPSCTICPDGSPVGLPDRMVNGFDDFDTCADLARLVSLYTDDQCVDAFGSAGFNFASWCGCAGVETPDACFLCGPDEEISDPNFIIPEANGLTCESGLEFARHIVDDNACENELKPNADLCCRPKPTAVPTESPSAVPTESSASASKLVVASTSGMLVVGSMMMLLL